MPETRVQPTGEQELTDAVAKALEEWFKGVTITAAVRWPGQSVWSRLVEEHVVPVAESIYRAASAVVSGEALGRFLDGVRNRLTKQSSLIEDIKAAQEKHGDAAADIDWTGADGDSQPWRSRAALIGEHESQVAPMQAATDSAGSGARKRWRHKGDDRVRSAHRAAGGQTRPINEPFSVGGAELMYPGDPSGPPAQTMNCRCEMFLISPDEGTTVEGSPKLLAAAVTLDEEAPLAPRDRDWDGDAARKALRQWATEGEDLDAEKMARGFLWADPEEAPSSWKLPVATVIDGTLTLVWSGITAAAAAVQGARTPIDLPQGDVDKVKSALSRLYERAAEEFEDDEITPPWEREAAMKATILSQVAMLADASSVNAANNAIEEAKNSLMEAAIRNRGGAWRPNAAWFAPPSEQARERMRAGEQPLVSDNGRVLGYVATWQQPDGRPTLHLGYLDAGQYQPVPGQQDYSYFHQNNINYPLSDGTSGHVGVITDRGHPTTVDDPAQQAALVRVGEDETGVWIAGAVFPDVMEDRMRFSRMKASAISGEWDLSTGQFRGAAMVNHPGFSQPTTRDQEFFALAASLGATDVAKQLLDNAPKLLALLEVQETPPTERDSDSEEEQRQTLTRASAEFLRGMAEHHQMGVDMGRQYLDRPETERDTDVTSLAQTILDQQTEQIGQMNTMLERAGDEPEEPSSDAENDPDKPMKMEASATLEDGVKIPHALQVLESYIHGTAEEQPGQQAVAGSIREAEKICRSNDVQHAAIRGKACKLVADYRRKAGA